MKKRAVEFRVRRPDQSFRLSLGTADTRKEWARLKALRDTCRRLADREEWDVLRAMKAGRVKVEAVARLIDQHGWDDYRARLDLDAAVDAPSLEEHARRWLDTLPHSGTHAIYRRDIARLSAFSANGRPLGLGPWTDVHPHHVQDAIQEIRKRLAANTARTCLAAWGAFFRWAVKREASEAAAEGRAPLVTSSPVRMAETWGQPRVTRHRFLTRAEYRKLIEVAAPEMRAQYATLVLCGLRIDEFVSLPPVHVYLPTHIEVAPWGTWSPKGYPRITRGVRDVPVHRAELLPLIEEYEREWAGDVTFFVNPTSGRPWSYSTFTARLRPDVEAAGMVYGQRKGGRVQPEGVTPHTFRHTLASWLAIDDVQLVKIARVLGDSEDTVRRHYVHLLPSDIDETLNRLTV